MGGPSVARTLKNAAHKARGQRALKYEIEVIPYFVGDIPKGVNYVCFCWERSSKIYVTDAEMVNQNTHAAFFKQYLRQNATIYMDNNEVVPKHYSFKIQKVEKSSKGEDDRKTIGKVKVDLAQFCDGQEDPQPQDIFLQCKPVGKVKLSIKAKWLKDAVVDADAMTEVTEMTDFTELSMTSKQGRKNKHRHGQDDGEDEEDDDDGHDEPKWGKHEQDLSGFDHAMQDEDGKDYSDGQHRRNDNDHDSDKRSRRKGRRRKQFAEEIPEGFEAPEDPDQAQGNGQAGTGNGVQGISKTPQVPVEGIKVHKKTWKDYLCCCLQEPAVLDAQEQTQLLNKSQTSTAAVPAQGPNKLVVHYDRPSGGQGNNHERHQSYARDHDDRGGNGEYEQGQQDDDGGYQQPKKKGKKKRRPRHEEDASYNHNHRHNTKQGNWEEEEGQVYE